MGSYTRCNDMKFLVAAILLVPILASADEIVIEAIGTDVVVTCDQHTFLKPLSTPIEELHVWIAEVCQAKK